MSKSIKKLTVVFLTILLILSLTAGSAWAIKPDNPGNSGKKVIQSEDVTNEEEAVEEDTEGTNTANQAKNRGQAKKLEERIRVRGMNMKFDVPPVIKEGRTLIPVRAVMNGLKADVQWDSETKTVTITRDDKTIVLNLITGEVTVNGTAITLDVPAQILSNRTFVPLRFIAQTLGDTVAYDEETGEINIGDEDTTDEDTTDEDTTDEDTTDEDTTDEDTTDEDTTDEDTTDEDTTDEDTTDEDTTDEDTTDEDTTDETQQA